jgi:hypothetical protein
MGVVMAEVDEGPMDALRGIPGEGYGRTGLRRKNTGVMVSLKNYPSIRAQGISSLLNSR